VRDRKRAREVDEEDDAGLERGDEQRVPALVDERELPAELTDALCDLLAREIDLADRVGCGRYDASLRR
jgi:hypothetical protein